MSWLLNCEEFDSFEFWISWVCSFLRSLSELVIKSERPLIQTLTQNVITHHDWRKKMILDFCHLLNCSNFCFLCFLWICTMIWFYSSLPKGKKNVWHVWLLESCVLMVLPSVQCFWEIIQLLAMCVLLIRRFHSCECYWPWGLLYTGSCSMWQLFLYIRLAIETRTPLPLPTLYILLMVEKARRILGVVSARLWLASVITLDTLIMFICLTLITKVTALREM